MHNMKINTTEIKQRYSLTEMMKREGHKLSMMGGLLKCLCPFHKEKTPSFCIYPDEHFNCFGCGANGDVIGYVMRRDGVKFSEAIAKLGGVVPVTFAQPVEWTAKPAETPYLAGADDMIVKWERDTDFDGLEQHANQLGVTIHSLVALRCVRASEHNAWAFPMKDQGGWFTGVRLRDNNGRKWAVKGSKEGLFYAPPYPRRPLFVVEGPTDTAAGLTLDLNIVGRPSCNGAVKELVALTERLKTTEVIIIADNDGPGLAGSERLQAHLTVPYRELVLPCKDLREFLKLGGTKQLLESMISRQLPQRRPGE